MKKFLIFILSLGCLLLVMTNAFASQTNNLQSSLNTTLKANSKNPTKPLIGFLSSGDYLNDSPSGITLRNSSIATQYVVTGLYLQALGTNCSSLTSYASLGYGAIWVKGTVPAGNSVSVGGNFLYNMILNFRFQTDNNIGPGTPGNPNNVSSPSPTSWCIKLGLVDGGASAASVTVSGNLISYGSATSITVSCDDTTEVCTAGAVTQDFPQ
jgi:hypothetical protein